MIINESININLCNAINHNSIYAKRQDIKTNKEINKLIKIELTIPLFYNDKTPIESFKFKEIKKDLIRYFGGLTINHNNTGYWKNNKNKVIKDIVDIYTIICDNNENNISLAKDCKDRFQILLKQDIITITITDLLYCNL